MSYSQADLDVLIANDVLVAPDGYGVPEEKPAAIEMKQAQGDSVFKKIMGHGYTAAFTSLLATTMTAGIFARNYLEENFGARSGWSTEATCEIKDTTGKIHHNFISGKNAPSPRDVFQSCAAVMEKPNFKLGEAALSFDKAIYGMKGMDGKLGTAVTGFNTSFTSGEDANLKARLQDLAFRTVEVEMQYKGQAFSGDWFFYQGLRSERALSAAWASSVNAMSQASSNAIDYTISGLSSMKQSIKPASPSPQQNG